MSPNMSLFSVNAILLLSTSDGSRILTKYYNAPHSHASASAHRPGSSSGSHPPASNVPGSNPYTSVKDQKAFEKGLLDKTVKSNSDVILYDNRVVLFKQEGDVMLYVVGDSEENEILLFSVVLCLRDALNVLLKSSADKRTILENYDLVSLAVDEIVDDGIILEIDPLVVASRVSRPPAQDMPNMKNIDLSEQGLLNAWEFGKMKLSERLRQGL
ncbi:MAG: Golgi-to-ER vesicle coat component [Cirrosporium novae-zelandiae]|nr:MAG: Golgi-to-ER vesicle coat component [Cirrosporium novae-zelandiae]